MTARSDDEFSELAINDLNFLFYSKVDGAYEDSGLADFFTKIEPLQEAFVKKIVSLIPKSTIRVKEFGSGPDLTRWIIISKTVKEKKWEIILTDFSENSLPNLKNYKFPKNFSLKTEKYNLLDGFNKLSPKEKVDVILITYGFDSVWFPQDLHLEKIKNVWHRAKYKITPLNSVREITDFQKIKIERKLEKVNLKIFEFGEDISEYYSHKTNVIVNFPGGLIKKVEEAFKTQIAPGGIFIIGDMAVDNRQGRISEDSPNGDPVYMKDYATSGKVAKFKVEDYGLAKIILESEGFNVELESVEDFIKNSGYEIPLEVKDHFILSIREN